MSATPSNSARRRFLGRVLTLAGGAALSARVRPAVAAPQAAPDPILGEIMVVSFDFVPRGWARCEGQHLPINQWQALFSVLGTTYGGNGVTTFALPDLRGRVALHFGTGPGLSPRTRGERAGTTTHTLALTEIPAHTHVARASSVPGTVADPSGAVVPARSAAGIPEWGDGVDAAVAGAYGATGAGQPHENLQPWLAMTFAIALVGKFPSP